MRRFEVWIDCDASKEEETREKVRAVLDEIDVDYTILVPSTEIIKKGSQK
jgi:hypothetical protein